MDEFWYHVISGAFTILGSLLTVFWGFHKWDKKIEIRHESNRASMANMADGLRGVSNKLSENTHKTIEIGSEIGEHIAEDKVIHEELKRRMDEIRGDIRDQRLDSRRNDSDARIRDNNK